jgi:hypothetical protein
MNASSSANSVGVSSTSVSPWRRAAGERAQPCEQLVERERLDEVVVGAAVEPGDPVRDRVARGQHQHRRPDACGAQPPARLEAVDARQHHVEHDRAVVGRAGHPERVLAGRRDVRAQPALAHPPPHDRGQLDLVLDDQNAHRGKRPTPEMSGR